jgi:hypothetical protein
MFGQVDTGDGGERWRGHISLANCPMAGDRVSVRKQMFHDDTLSSEAKEPTSGVGWKWCVPAAAGLRSRRGCGADGDTP